MRQLIHRIAPCLGLRRAQRPENTIAQNLATWSTWDWSQCGEEWSNHDHPQWKQSLVDQVLAPRIPIGSRVLEIGPGAGRWTQYLVERASRVVLVDLTPRCIELCRQRFAKHNHIEYYVNDGSDLCFIEPSSIDRIWSFDVFVHMLAADVEIYIEQFGVILAQGGQGIIHHGCLGRRDIGWRSDLTAEGMQAICKRHGLRLLEQFQSWDSGRFHLWPELPLEQDPDIITVFERSVA